jgi:CRP-like cAMP-binding protein
MFLIHLGELIKMNANQITQHINKLGFFDGFTPEEKGEIASFTENVVRYPKKNFIIQQGTIDPSIHVLLDGQVVLRIKEKPDVDISCILPGSIFGTIPELPVTPRKNNAIAVTDTLVLRLDRPMLNKLNPAIINKFNVEFIKVLFRRLSELNERTAQDRGEIVGISNAYGQIKNELDNTGALTNGTLITSNLIYHQLKKISSPLNR